MNQFLFSTLFALTYSIYILYENPSKLKLEHIWYENS